MLYKTIYCENGCVSVFTPSINAAVAQQCVFLFCDILHRPFLTNGVINGNIKSKKSRDELWNTEKYNTCKIVLKRTKPSCRGCDQHCQISFLSIIGGRETVLGRSNVPLIIVNPFHY